MKIGMFQINFRRVGIFILLGVVLALVMNFNTRLVELTRLQNEVATVRAQATGVMVTQVTLQTQVALATSPAAVEAYARGEAHMSKPGDNVVVIMPVPGFTPQASPTPTPAVNDLTPLQVWMKFIFGK
jgi:uncharacterized protein (DUF58 family)